MTKRALPLIQKRNLEERIDTLLLEGLDSGQPITVTTQYWNEMKRQLEAFQASVIDVTAVKSSGAARVMGCQTAKFHFHDAFA
jgi:hypothetical protein